MSSAKRESARCSWSRCARSAWGRRWWMAGGAGRTGGSPLPPSSGGSRGPRNQGVPGSPAQSWLPLTCPVPELLAPVSAWSSLPPPGAWGRPDSSRQSPKSPTDRPEREDGVTEALPPRPVAWQPWGRPASRLEPMKTPGWAPASCWDLETQTTPAEDGREASQGGTLAGVEGGKG